MFGGTFGSSTKAAHGINWEVLKMTEELLGHKS